MDSHKTRVHRSCSSHCCHAQRSDHVHYNLAMFLNITFFISRRYCSKENWSLCWNMDHLLPVVYSHMHKTCEYMMLRDHSRTWSFYKNISSKCTPHFFPPDRWRHSWPVYQQQNGAQAWPYMYKHYKSLPANEEENKKKKKKKKKKPIQTTSV